MAKTITGTDPATKMVATKEVQEHVSIDALRTMHHSTVQILRSIVIHMGHVTIHPRNTIENLLVIKILPI